MKNRRLLLSAAVLCLLLSTVFLFSGCYKAPSISSISPSSTEPGEKITIEGKNFGDAQGNWVVDFGIGLEADIGSWSDSSITCRVPVGLPPHQYQVIILNGDKRSNEVTFTVEETDDETTEEEVEKTKEEENLDQTEEGGLNEDLENCKEAMLAYATQNSESGIEFSFSGFWMDDAGVVAEAVLDGQWVSGPNKGQSTESPGITAEKQGGSWVVTDFGTGIELRHL